MLQALIKLRINYHGEVVEEVCPEARFTPPYHRTGADQQTKLRNLQSINQSSTNQSINQVVNQSINQSSTNQAINQSRSQ